MVLGGCTKCGVHERVVTNSSPGIDYGLEFFFCWKGESSPSIGAPLELRNVNGSGPVNKVSAGKASALLTYLINFDI